MDIWCKVYLADSSSMVEVQSGTVQLAITSLPDIHLRPLEDKDRVTDNSKALMFNRMFVIEHWFPFLRPMVNEIHRVLKDDGVFFLNIGSPVRFWTISGYSVLLPLIMAEYIVTMSNLWLRRDFIANPAPNTGAISNILREEKEKGIAGVHQHYIMFSKGNTFKFKPPHNEVLSSSWFFRNESNPLLEKFARGEIPTPFPRDILRSIIEAFSDEGDTILDPCAGSGSIAAVGASLSRNSIVYEIQDRFEPIIKEHIALYNKEVSVEVQRRT